MQHALTTFVIFYHEQKVKFQRNIKHQYYNYGFYLKLVSILIDSDLYSCIMRLHIKVKTIGSVTIKIHSYGFVKAFVLLLLL